MDAAMPGLAAGGALRDFIGRHERIFVLTGAGCSTHSGIPDYRDADGTWKQAPPMNYQTFMKGHAGRQRYWARSLAGWPLVGAALPNDAHHALAQLEARGQCEVLVTQNVDGLHHRAGSRNVIDLHGRLDQVRCMGCGALLPRAAMQARLLALNPDWAELRANTARMTPDGDVALERDFSSFNVPDCAACGGILKPDVVFFGENVPRDRAAAAFAHLDGADAVLVVGSSLMIHSGFRFVDAAMRAGKPVAAVNLGRTRADGGLTLKVAQPCAVALAFLL